ncbi:MAG: aminoacetone oxidase family FAD-binding enzyme, partial [bacterium]
TRSEPDGRVLPLNDRADGVLAVLRAFLKENKVRILHNTTVTTIHYTSENKESISGVTLSDGSRINGTKLIIATGGKSYPKTGSTGEGYEMARQSGHTIVSIRAGLSALESNYAHIKALQGLTLKEIAISVIIDEEKKFEAEGDILFTHFGVSGPVVLNLSGDVIDALAKKRKVELSLNLRKDYTTQEFDQALQKELSSFGSRTVAQYFNKTLPSSLSALYEKLNLATSKKKCSTVSREERKQIAACLTDLRIPIIRPRPIEEATITRGGVALKELNPQTMESKVVKGLYFCGEMIDLAGLTGGYNLQEAFSTGYLAGESAK